MRTPGKLPLSGYSAGQGESISYSVPYSKSLKSWLKWRFTKYDWNMLT